MNNQAAQASSADTVAYELWKEKAIRSRPACREQIPAQSNLTPEIVEAVLANSIATMGAPGRIHLGHKDLPEGAGHLGFSLNALAGGLHHYANIDEQQAWIDNLTKLVNTVRANMGGA